MGMFDKDKLYGGTPLEKWTLPNVDFILRGARIATEEFPLENGDKATKSELFVSSMDNPDEVVKVSTLSGVTAEKVKDAEADDFPAVCQFQTVPTSTPAWNDAKVVKFIRPYEGDPVSFDPDAVNDGDAIDRATKAA